MAKDALVTQLRLLAPAFVEGADDPAAGDTPPDREIVAARPEGTRPGEPEPAGKALADVLVAGLVARGWEVEYRWVTYTSHAFEARRPPSRYDVEVQLIDPTPSNPDMPPRGLWRLSAKPRTKFFQRLFSTAIDPNEHTLLRLHLEETLDHDPRTAKASPPNRGAWRTEAEDLELAPDALGDRG